MFHRIKHMIFFTPPWLPILSGIFIGTSYIPFPPWASLFAFVPLWVQWQKSSSLKEVFISGWITQFVLTLIGFSWMAQTFHDFGGFPIPLAYLAQILFAAIANLYIPLAGVIWFKIQTSIHSFRFPSGNVSTRLYSFSNLLSLPLILWFLETWTPTIFKWNFGYSFFFAQLPAYHLAEIIGFEGLSALVFLMNLISLKIWTSRSCKLMMAKWALGGLTFFGCINFAGWTLSQRLPLPDRKAHILVVQSNIGNQQKFQSQSNLTTKAQILNKYIELTLKEVRRLDSSTPSPPPIDFILWPETAFPSYLGVNFKNLYTRQLIQTIRELKIPFVIGAYGQNLKSRKTSNSIFFIDENGRYRGRPYDKSLLLPFGEYLPMEETFPILRKWFPQVGNFAPGNGPFIKPFKGLLLGSQICYESLFPHLSIELANQGAQLIVNVTNDSWYGTTQEPYQHLYESLARAIEVRRPLIRATNTGISTAILANGEILESSLPNQEWTHTFEVPYASQPQATIYQSFPWAFPSIMLLAFLATLIRVFYQPLTSHQHLDTNLAPSKKEPSH